MRRQDAALGKAAGMEKETGCYQYNPAPDRKQVLAVEWFRRQSELRASGLRAAYDYVKSLYRGGLL
jgi:hypothetical protein